MGRIVYGYLYSASLGIGHTEAFSVHFSSKKNVRLKTRETKKEEERIEERKGGGRRFEREGPAASQNLVWAENHHND